MVWLKRKHAQWPVGGTGGGGGGNHPGRCSVPAGGYWAFQTGLCQLCSALSDPVSWEQGLQWWRRAGGHIGVRGGVGVAGGSGIGMLPLTWQPLLLTQQCQPWSDVSRPHISLSFVTSPCVRWVVSPLVAFHMLISMKPLQTTSLLLREAVRVEPRQCPKSHLMWVPVPRSPGLS